MSDYRVHIQDMVESEDDEQVTIKKETLHDIKFETRKCRVAIYCDGMPVEIIEIEKISPITISTSRQFLK